MLNSDEYYGIAIVLSSKDTKNPFGFFLIRTFPAAIVEFGLLRSENQNKVIFV
jgi:hypothetical protein